MTLKTPVPSLTLLHQPSLMQELSSSRETMDLTTKHATKKVCEWYETWRPWQQRTLLCGLTDRCSKPQLESLATTLEPVFHRDFVTTVKQRYPSAPFRHMKKREQEKQKKAEQKRIAKEKSDLEEQFSTMMPGLSNSDFDLYQTLIAVDEDVENNSPLEPIELFARQLSARLIVGAVNTLKADPGLFSERSGEPARSDEETEEGKSPDLLVVSGRLASSQVQGEESDDLPPLAVPSYPSDHPRKLTMIAEEPSQLSQTSPQPRSPSPQLESEKGTSPELSKQLSGPEDGTATSASESEPKPETTPVKKRKAKPKDSSGVKLLDLPALKVVDHRHRSAVGTASEVATVDFFLGEKTEKLGFLQREMRRGPVRKPVGIQEVMLPLQKCYKHVKLCSDSKPYVRAHRSKLQSQFKRQLKQVWLWTSEWKEYERLALLTELTKLCDSQMIQYLCQCLTTRLRARTDINSLSDQLLLTVFSYLDYDSIENSSNVCARWRYLCNHDFLWQRKCKQIGREYGVANVNRIIVKSRRKSKQIDWKLAYLEIMKIGNETRNAKPKPDHVEIEQPTPDGMVRIDGKFYPIPETDRSVISESPKRRGTVSEIWPVKRGTIFFLRDQGFESLLEKDEETDSFVDMNEYSMFLEEEDKSKKGRRKTRVQGTYGSSFDVSGRNRFEHKDHISEEDEGGNERPGSRMVKRKKRRREEEEPALDVRPELHQAKDLMNTNVPRRTLVWREPHKPELKQKTAKFAGEVQSVQRVRKLQGHLDSVLCIAISRRRMISGSMDRSIRIWDLLSGKSIHKFYGHMGGVRCLYFEGSLLVSGSWDMQAMIWDLIKFDRKAILSGHRGSISCVQFNQKYIVTGSHDKTARVYCMRSYDLHRVVKGHTKEITALKVDGSDLITASSDQTVRLTDLDTGICSKVFQLPEHAVSLCLQNDLLIVGNGLGQCHFLNKQTGTVEAGIEVHKNQVSQVLIHKNRFYTCSNDSTVKEWDLVTMTCIRYLQGPRGPIRDLKVDDKHIISCGDDGSIWIWDIALPPQNERGSAHGDVVPSAVVKKK